MSGRSIPKMARATSVRPLPMSPAIPTTSPARTLRSMFLNFPSEVSPCSSRTVSPRTAADRSYRSPSARPTMSFTISSSVTSDVRRVSTKAPSRSTVRRSEILKISSRRWPTNIIATPCSLRRSITSNRRSTSAVVRAAVGSSRIRTFASETRALAISTSCCSDTRREPTGIVTGRSSPSWARTFWASAFILA